MKILFKKREVVKLIANKKNLGFVPTMGAIHIGHISLFKRSLSECDKTIVSIFINKPQFSKKRDYEKYPRSLKEDINKLKKLNIDYFYIPSHNEIYPHGINKKIKINKFSKNLCGKYRPRHFESVVDVIDRFIKIINPLKIYFGEKDMQQLLLIKDFVKKKYKKIKILGCKTIRERSGIPYSSRNLLLSTKDKKIASNIFNFLFKRKKLIINKKIKINEIRDKIFSLGARKIDYIKIIDINKIIRPYISKNKYKIFIAYYLNSIRLIDNF